MSTDHSTTGFHAPALVAACVLPGLGHIARGEKQRGLCILASLLSLYCGGLLLGGVDVIDSKEDRVWFYGQALVGPTTFGIDYYHQNHLKVRAPADDRSGRMVLRSAYPTEGRNPDGSVKLGGRPPNTKSVGRMNELGTLACALAGMINLIAIIDAAFPTIRPKRRFAGPALVPGASAAGASETGASAAGGAA